MLLQLKLNYKTEVEYVIGNVNLSEVKITAYMEDGTVEVVPLSTAYVRDADEYKLEEVGSHDVNIFCYGASAVLKVTIKEDHQHALSDWIVKQEASCENDGLKVIECTICHKVTEEEVIKANGHELVHYEEVLPTCEASGNKAYDACKNCSYTTYEELPAKGHNLTTIEELKATCTQDGHNEYVECSNCDYTTFETIESLGHKAGDWNVLCNATSDTDGLKQLLCLSCDYVLDEEILPCTNPSNLAYTVNADGITCTITGLGTSTDTMIVIPSYIDGYKVTIIGSGAFSSKSTITSVVMQDSIEVINATAFNNCKNITKKHYKRTKKVID